MCFFNTEFTEFYEFHREIYSVKLYFFHCGLCVVTLIENNKFIWHKIIFECLSPQIEYDYRTPKSFRIIRKCFYSHNRTD